MDAFYNKDKRVSHLRCFKTEADFVYAHPRKNDAVTVIKEVLNMGKHAMVLLYGSSELTMNLRLVRSTRTY
jgi:hypothetical protein